MMDIGNSYIVEPEICNNKTSVCVDDLSLYTAVDEKEDLKITSTSLEEADELSEDFEQMSEAFKAMVD